MKVSVSTALAAAMLVAGVPALAQSSAESGPPAVQNSNPAAKAAVPSGSGVMVFIDPVTGQIRQPEPGEMQALSPKQPATAEGPAAGAPAVIMLPGGGKAVKVDESYDSHVVVTKNPDGSLNMNCLPAGQAGQVVAPGAPVEQHQHRKGAVDVE